VGQSDERGTGNPRLVGCPVCGRMVSPSATTCPQCGHRLRRRTAPALLIVVATFAIAAVILGTLAVVELGIPFAPTLRFPWSPTPAPPPTVSAIVSKTESAVVTVKAILFRTGTSEGSGFLIDKEGDVITNAHVVAHATDVSVIDSRGVPHSVTLIGIDQAEDLAEVRVPDLAHHAPLTPASRVPAVGTDILVIGNPFGQLPETVTKGIISGVGRDETVGGTYYRDLLQIDAVVNPGNSGGPVVDLTGRVVGVLTIGSSLSRFGFAIPITSVTGLARRWADADSPVLLGPPMVAADAKTLVLQSADVPFGFTLAVGQEWGPNDPKSWKAEYHRLPTYLVNGQYITSYVQITSSTGDAKRLFGSYSDAAKTHGYQNQGLTGHLGDETLTFVLHESDIDHFEVLWRDRNVVSLLQTDVVAGEANLGNAFQLAAKQQAHIEADLKGAGYT
jgi:hypothetical protein